MTGWYLLYGILVVATAAGLLIPLALAGRARGLGRAEAELAMHQSRFRQMQSDREGGLISASEATDTEAEIGREILRAAREADAESQTGPARGGFWPVATLSVLTLATGIGLYALIGSPGMRDLPLAARELPPAAGTPTLASEHEGSQIQTAIASLRARLAENPGNAENWLLLARSYSAVGADAEAALAYERLLELVPLDLEARGNYAEALIRKDDGFVGPQAIKQLEIVLAHAPKDPRARYYLALHHAQAGRDRDAALGWAGILRDAPADAPYRPAIRRILDAIIADAGLDPATLDIPEEPVPERAPATGPTAADVAAAADMTDDDREAMIRSMVDQLEARLADDPGDIEGWLRLARSRVVLGDRDAAIAALERGIAANADAPALAAALAELTAGAAE